MAFFFLFFLHGTSIGTRQQGISYNDWVFVKCGYHKCLIKEQNFISHILQIPCYMMLKNNTIIAVTKKGSILPVKLFNDWWKCGKWCDEFIKKDKGCDPTQYEINKVEGLKKFVYALFFNFI